MMFFGGWRKLALGAGVAETKNITCSINIETNDLQMHVKFHKKLSLFITDATVD
jgi:hypothetical protein